MSSCVSGGGWCERWCVGVFSGCGLMAFGGVCDFCGGAGVCGGGGAGSLW